MPLEIITHDSILGRSMLGVNKAAHDAIAKQMAEYEKKHRVYVAKMGETGDKQISMDSIKGKLGAKAARQSSESGGFGKMPASGHRNLLKRRDGLFKVLVNGVDLGVHDKETALKVRDKYRVENNLPAADC